MFSLSLISPIMEMDYSGNRNYHVLLLLYETTMGANCWDQQLSNQVLL